MFEYELSVNIRVEKKEVIDNLLITVEALKTGELGINAVELLSISALKFTNKKKVGIVENYEQDSWLSPLKVR